MKEFIFVFVAKLLKKYYNKIIYEEESYEKIMSLLLMMSFILAGCSSSKSADTMKY